MMKLMQITYFSIPNSFPSEENVAILLKLNSKALAPDKNTVFNFCPS